MFFRSKENPPESCSSQEKHDNEKKPQVATKSASTTRVLEGRRIVDISSFIEQVKELDEHSPFGCSFKNMDFLRETRCGLNSRFTFRCKMCNIEKTLVSDLPMEGKLSVNHCAVSGIISSGGGHTMLEDIISSMNIPCMSASTFNRYHNDVCDNWEKIAAAEMQDAVNEEARIAREKGEVASDGVPLIKVVADASWCKRSYRTNYSSLSGVVSKNCSQKFILIILWRHQRII